jgi:hypothetical protein
MTIKGRLMAATLAGLFSTIAPVVAFAGGDDAGKVKCEGANGCKGKSSCKSAKNACAGKNGCAGKGWVFTRTAKECTDKGGKVVAEKPAPTK